MKKIPESTKLMAAFLAIVFTYQMLYPSATVRFRITVEVDTPEGVKTGSAVREVTMMKVPQFLGASAEGGGGVKGEAVVVDLGSRGYLFSLLKNTPVSGSAGSDDLFLLQKSFPFEGDDFSREGIHYYAALKRHSTAVLPPDRYPLFVHFKDIHDPASVEAVYSRGDPRIEMQARPGSRIADFETAFAPGVSIHQIKIEITDEPVTWEIDKVLPWLEQPENLSGDSFDGDKTKIDLIGADFSTGNHHLWSIY